jgi:hypothetical protein
MMPTALNDRNLVPYSAIHCNNTSTCLCINGVIEGDTCRYVPAFSINMGNEIIFLVALVLVMVLLWSLQIHVSSTTKLSKAQKALKEDIRGHSDQLRSELMQFRNENNHPPAFDSPITKVIRMIRMLQLEDDSLDVDSVDRLDYVVHLLGSSQLFEPQLKNTNMESEVSRWLKQITNHDEAEENIHIPATERACSAVKRKFDGTEDPNIRSLLQNIDSWDFSIFSLHSATNGTPLFHLVMELFQIYKFEECLQVSQATMVNFVKEVEIAYRKV